MVRHFFVVALAALSLAASIAACSNTNPLPTNAANRAAPDAAPGTCTPPAGTGTCQ